MSINPQDNPISLDTTVDTNIPIQLDAENAPSYNITPELVDTKANKIDYSLQDTPAQMPYDQIQQFIGTGDEQGLRQQAASKLTAAASEKRAQTIIEAINAKNGPLSPEDMKWIDGTAPAPYINPDYVFETSYSQKYFDEVDKFAQKQGDDNFWNVATQEVPYLKKAAVSVGHELLTKREIILSVLQDNAAKMSGPNYSPIQAAVDWTTLNLVPGRYNIGVRGNMDTGFLEGGTTSNNLEAQRNKLWASPIGEFAQKFRSDFNNLASKNRQLAAMWGTRMLGESSSDKFLDTLNDAFDLSTIGSVAASAGRVGRASLSAARATKDMWGVIKDVMKASGSPEQTKATILASVGDVKGAAVEQASTQIAKDIAGQAATRNLTPTETALEAVPRYFRLEKEDIKANSGNLAENATNILLEDYNKTESRFLYAVANMMKIDGVPLEAATKEQVAKLAETVPDRYPGIRNNVLHIENPVLDPVSNTYNVTFGVGKRPGELFRTPQEATNYIKAQGIQDATIDRQGAGFFFKITRPLNQNETAVGDFIAGVKGNERPAAMSPESWTDIIPGFAKVRTSEDTMSAEHSANRKAAVYPQAILYGLLHEEAKLLRTTPGFKAITRRQWKDLRRVLEDNQTMPDPLREGQKGVYFKNPQELSEHYVQTLHRTPELPEVRAYFAVKRMTEIDRALREVALYHNQARLGAETIQVVATDAATGQSLKSIPFSAVSLNKLPGGRGRVLVMGDSIHSAEYEEFGDIVEAVKKVNKKEAKAVGEAENLDRKLGDTRKKLDLTVQSGKAKLYRIYDPEQRPLNGFVTDGEKRIEFVLAPNIESKALDWDQVPRLGGGHFDYDYTHYVKQAIINREFVGGAEANWYEGDRTAMPVAYRKIGEDIVPHMNQVRRMLNPDLNGGKADVKGARTYAKQHLPFDGDEFVDHFFPKKDPTGKVNLPMFNIHEDFRIVPKSQAIIDIDNTLRDRYGKGFRDGTREGSLARNFQVEYTGQRDARDMFAVVDKGTRNNPVYAINDAKLVDPITTMNRALNRIVRSTVMDEYKNYAVTSWLREAQPHLQASESEVRAAPFFHFLNANENSFVRGFRGSGEYNKLMANQFKIQQLTGAPSALDNFVYRVATELKEATYKYAGPAVADKIVPTWLLPKLRDPAAFIRSVTFDAFLGVFSIPQFFVQNMTYVNIFAQSPTHAVSGTMGAFFHQLTRLNKHPEIVDKLDELATKINIKGIPAWKSGEFKEAMAALDRTGFAVVGGEIGYLDTLKANKVIRGPAGEFMEMGRFFFKEGERNVRYGAWYTAFKEFRTEHPTGALTNADLVKITNRADLLYGNMSSASNSILHTGILSTATQFFAYTIRLQELFLGKRIGATPQERMLARARIMGMNAAMFGVPMAFGAAGLPVADYLRKQMMENGFFGMTSPYVEDPQTKTISDWIQTMFMNGLPNMMIAAITGKSYNIGPRYGSAGFTQINEALGGDASFLKIAGGASYTLAHNLLTRDLAGWSKIMTAMVTKNPEGFKITPEDVLDPLKQLYIVNRGFAARAAINTGKWINNNADVIDSVGWKNSIFGNEVGKGLDILFRVATGLTPQEQADIWNKRVTMKDRQADLDEVEKRFLTEMNRGYLAQNANNPEQAEKYFSSAIGWLIAGDVDENRIASMLAKVNNRNPNLIFRTNWEYYTKLVNPKYRDRLLKAFERTKQEN